jgi:hypothetical protein
MGNAVALLLRLQAELPQVPVSELAGRAIDATYCTNLIVGSDAVVCHLGSARASLMFEAIRLAHLRIGRSMLEEADGDTKLGGSASSGEQGALVTRC